MKAKKDSLMNHVKIAILPLRCSDCHKIIWPFNPYIIGLMPYVGQKKLCTKGNNCCASNYTLLESKSNEGTYFLERISKNANKFFDYKKREWVEVKGDKK